MQLSCAFVYETQRCAASKQGQSGSRKRARARRFSFSTPRENPFRPLKNNRLGAVEDRATSEKSKSFTVAVFMTLLKHLSLSFSLHLRILFPLAHVFASTFRKAQGLFSPERDGTRREISTTWNHSLNVLFISP